MEAAGAEAVVLHSLFEEQIELESAELDRFLNESARTRRQESVTQLP